MTNPQGLIWQIGCIGEQVCNENPTGVVDLLTWQEVLELLKQPQYKNWRLPTKEELLAVEITQNIMYIANNKIASYTLIKINLLIIGLQMLESYMILIIIKKCLLF
jgi:hypothetical protein